MSQATILLVSHTLQFITEYEHINNKPPKK